MSTVYGQYAAYGFSADRNGDWRKRAACRTADPETFFPVGESGLSQLQAEAAKRFCHTNCADDVRAACLKWALDMGIEHGVWGGKSAKQRTKMTAEHTAETEPEFRKTRQCRDCAGTFELEPQFPLAQLCAACVTPTQIRQRAKRAGAR